MEQSISPFVADRANPQEIVPSSFIHSFETPFCPLSSCGCHTNQAEIAKLLEYVREGLMTLQEAANFANGWMV